MTDHRHTPEIEQELSALAGQKTVVQFTPSPAPMNRGILSTCYANLKDGVGEDEIGAAYAKWYAEESFIRLMGTSLPETRFVKNTNTTAIGWKVDPRTRRVIAFGALDNLIKVPRAGSAEHEYQVRFCGECRFGSTVVNPCRRKGTMKILEGGITAATGFSANGIACGLKKRKKDLALVVSDSPVRLQEPSPRTWSRRPSVVGPGPGEKPKDGQGNIDQ